MRKISAITLMLMLAACGPTLTLQPLWDEQHLVAEPGLEGQWIDSDGERILRFRQGGDKRYTVDFVTADGASRYDGHLVRLGDHLFLDLCLGEKAANTLIEGQAFAPLLPAHFFARLRLDNGRLHLGLLAIEDMQKQIEAGVIKAQTAKAEGDVILTGDTRELQEAVSALAGSEDWDETVFTRSGTH